MARTTADSTSFNPNGNNIETLSTILDGYTRSVNVNAWSTKPIDGSLIPYSGFGKATVSQPDAGAELFATGDAKSNSGGLLHMMWSNRSRSDLSALNFKKVPVFVNEMIIKTCLYNYDKDQAITPGDLVMVSGNFGAIGTALANTLWIPDICTMADAVGGVAGWQIGVVLQGAAASALVNSSSTNTKGTDIIIKVFSNPRLLNIPTP